MWSVKCGNKVRSAKCGVWSVKDKVWSGEWGVSVKCEGWSGEWGVQSVKCGVWSVECEV